MQSVKICIGFNWLRIGSSEHVHYMHVHDDNIIKHLGWVYDLTI
jgi:hypothetical protein